MKTESSPGNRTVVVLVHGLWQRGWSMRLLARRLRALGHEVEVFSYPTRGDGLDGHADALHAFLAGMNAGELHLVGHSMGGLVVLNLLRRYDDVPSGRVVLMGSPVKGSNVVRRLAKLPGHGLLFGRAREILLQGYGHIPAQRDTGMIRGTRALGLGLVAGRAGEPSDGTVALSETEADGLGDSTELAVSHTEMLWSADVAAQVGHFLQNGKFFTNR